MLGDFSLVWTGDEVPACLRAIGNCNDTPDKPDNEWLPPGKKSFARGVPLLSLTTRAIVSAADLHPEGWLFTQQ